jgi:uncharacterized protein involved in outer membrane biogenesis
MNQSPPTIRRPSPHHGRAWLRTAFLIGGGIVAIALVTGLIAPYFLDVDRYRSDISAQLSAQTGRAITLGKIRVRVFPTVGFTVEEFRMGNPHGFSPGEFMSAAGIRGTLAFWPLVLRREIRIQAIDFIGPKLALLQDQRGADNYTFPSDIASEPGSSVADTAPGPPYDDRIGTRGAAPKLAPGATVFQIEHITLRAAEVIFGGIGPDHHVMPTVDATGFDVTLRHLTAEPVRVKDWQSDAKLDGARFTLAGWDGPIVFRSGSATLRDGRLESTFSADFGKASRLNGTFSIADVEHAVVKFDLHTDDVDADALVAEATMKPFRIPASVESTNDTATPVVTDASSARASRAQKSGKTTARTETAKTATAQPPPAPLPAAASQAGTAGTGELLAEGHLSAERVRSGAQIAGPATADLRLYSDRMEIWPVTARFANGSLQISARTDRRQSPQRFSINVQARNLNVGEIVVTSPALRGKFAGTGELDLQLFGSLDDAWQKSLSGKGQFAIRNGRIAGFSLYGATQALTSVAAASGDTTFTAISGDVAVNGARIESGDTHLDSPRGTADLRGNFGFDGSLNYDGQVSALVGPAAADVATTSAASSVSGQPQNNGSSKLQIKNGKLTIPFMLRGTLQNPTILPGNSKVKFAAPAQLQHDEKSDSSFPNLFQK